MIERGVSITELHRHSGVAESVIRQIREEQTLRPSESTIGRLADGFDSFENARADGHRKWPPMDPIWLYDGELEEGREL